MKRNVLLLVVLAVAALAMAASGWPTQGQIVNFPGLVWGWDNASGTARPAAMDANGLLQATIASGTVNALPPYTLSGVATAALLDGAHSVNVNRAVQPASYTRHVLTAGTELVLTNVTNQTMISIQNQGVGDLWVTMNASAAVSDGFKLVADSMFEISMKSTDAVSMISSTTPVVVVMKQ